MGTFYDAIDLLWTDDGDYAVSREGDVADTEFDALLAIKQDMYDRVKSDKMDYAEAPETGATLSDFVGETNTRERGMEIERRVFSSFITGGDSISLGDVSIRVFPTSLDTVNIRVELRVKPTPWNQQTRLVSMNLLYAYNENHVYPVDQIPQE